MDKILLVTNTIILMLSSLWATVSIPFVPPNSANGVPMCCANLPSVVMS